MRSRSHVLVALLLAPLPAFVAAQDPGGGAQASGGAPPWAVSVELVGGFDAVYGGWRRVLRGVDVGVEFQTALGETSVEVDRLDRPGEVNGSSDRDQSVIGVGPSVRWRILSSGRLSPVVRAHAGYLRSRITVRDDTGDFDRTADGAVVRASMGVEYRASRHLDVALGLAARWSVLEGEVLFHANETSRTSELDLFRPAVAVLIRF